MSSKYVKIVHNRYLQEIQKHVLVARDSTVNLRRKWLCSKSIKWLEVLVFPDSIKAPSVEHMRSLKKIIVFISQ